MGSRPFIAVIVGLEYSESLYKKEVELDLDEPIVPALIEGKFNLFTGKYKDYDGVCLYDVFYSGPPYSSSLNEPSGVIGYIADAIYDQPLTRALFALWERSVLGHNVTRQEYQWPQSKERDRRLRLSKLESGRARQNTELAYSEDRMYRYFCGPYGEAESDNWFKCSLYLLHTVGFTEVKRKDLQAYIVFGWN